MWAAVGWAFGWRVMSVALVIGARTTWRDTNSSVARFSVRTGCCSPSRVSAWLAAGECGQGMALTWSALLRVFPAIIVLGLLLKVLVDSLENETLGDHRGPLAICRRCVSRVVVWLPLSLTLTSGERSAFSVWEEFVRNTRKHAAGSALNQVGLRVVLAFDPNMRAERISKFWIDSPWDAWREARQRTVQTAPRFSSRHRRSLPHSARGSRCGDVTIGWP